MFERDLEKLLGGFAVDTSVPEKRIRLYIAAMQDQQFSNALADEQALWSNSAGYGGSSGESGARTPHSPHRKWSSGPGIAHI